MVYRSDSRGELYRAALRRALTCVAIHPENASCVLRELMPQLPPGMAHWAPVLLSECAPDGVSPEPQEAALMCVPRVAEESDANDDLLACGWVVMGIPCSPFGAACVVAAPQRSVRTEGWAKRSAARRPPVLAVAGANRLYDLARPAENCEGHTPPSSDSKARP